MRPSAASLAPSGMLPRVVCRSRFLAMGPSPFPSAAGFTSTSAPGMPASAATCAMPLPIRPAPITPSFCTSAIFIHPTRKRPPDALCAGRPRSSRSRLLLAELGLEFRHHLEQVADQAVIGHLEDRRLLVLVDGDDDLAVLHAGQVLDGARDADGDVEVGCDDLAGLADLVVVRRIAGIDRGARGAHRGTEQVGDALDDVEVLGA